MKYRGFTQFLTFFCLSLFLFLLFYPAASGRARMLLVLRDPNCVQVDYRATCPWSLPATLDPNVAAVLGPYPKDPDHWTVPLGTYTRSIFYCHPYGFSIVQMEILSGSASADLSPGTDESWLLTCDLREPGRYSWIIRVNDPYGGRVDFMLTLEAEVPADSRPVVW